jgi:hypothetical protein
MTDIAERLLANASAWTLGHKVIPAIGLADCRLPAFLPPVSSVVVDAAVVPIGAAASWIRPLDGMSCPTCIVVARARTAESLRRIMRTFAKIFVALLFINR